MTIRSLPVGDGGILLVDDAQMPAAIGVLFDKAAAALTNNQTFLGIATPTQAQAVAQVQALTRQVDALIRLQIGQLDTTAGT